MTYRSGKANESAALMSGYMIEVVLARVTAALNVTRAGWLSQSFATITEVPVPGLRGITSDLLRR